MKDRATYLMDLRRRFTVDFVPDRAVLTVAASPLTQRYFESVLATSRQVCTNVLVGDNHAR